MPIEIIEEPIAALAAHAATSIAFQVESVLHIEEAGDQLAIAERAVEAPYRRDDDALNPPARWAERFDVSRWGLLTARLDGERVGGVVIAFGSSDVDLLEGRADLAVVWDLRVAPGHRRRGIGSALFRAAEDWAASQGCTELRVETQNTNVPACAFCERQGCELRAINADAYPALPDDVQLIWVKIPRAL